MNDLNQQGSKAELQKLQRAFELYSNLSESLSESVEKLNSTVKDINVAQPAYDCKDDDTQLARHLRALVDAIPGGLVVLDPQGLVVVANEAALSLLGEEISQEPWRTIVNRVFLPELDQGELTTADGRQFSISTRPLGFQPGQIVLLSDVTQTRQLQRAAQQNLHLMTMGKMMASLAHQIRTPLSSTLLYLSQIIEGDLDQDTRQSFNEKALARVKHIEKMINDMLVFAHGGQFNMSQFSVRDLISDLYDHIKPQLELRHALLRISGDDTPALLRGNKNALLGALSNLCMNSLDAANDRPTINISVRMSLRGMLSITVQDNGCGIDLETYMVTPHQSTVN